MQKVPNPPDDLGKIGRKAWKKIQSTTRRPFRKSNGPVRLQVPGRRGAHMETVSRGALCVRPMNQTREHPAAQGRPRLTGALLPDGAGYGDRYSGGGR